jgi:hypothetical protein
MSKRAILFALFLLLSVASCAAPAEPTTTPVAIPTIDPNVERYAIFESGQEFIGDLRISAGDFVMESYTDHEGSKQTGLTCGLTVFVQNKPTPDRTERVYPGKNIEIAGHRVLVDGIEKKHNERGIVFITVIEPG